MLPVLAALGCALEAVVVALHQRFGKEAAPPGPRALLGPGVVLAAGGLAALPHLLRSPTPLGIVVGLTLLCAISGVPALLMSAGAGEPSGAALRKSSVTALALVIAAIVLLVVAESLGRTLSLGQVLAWQAVDQVGEIRLAALRPELQGTPVFERLVVQSLLAFPVLLTVVHMLLPGVPLLWPLGLQPILQALWQAPASRVVASGLAGVPVASAFVLALGVGLHPTVMDKSSWDINPAGCLLFVLAWTFEARRRFSGLFVSLVLSAVCHPIQACGASLWAADHARRSWGACPPERRWRLAALPLSVGAVTALSLGTLLLAPLFIPEDQTLMARLAAFGRQSLVRAFRTGDGTWILGVIEANIAKAALILLPLGFLPVLRWNRFLAYSSFELLYSIATPNGFLHGSLAGLVGALGCAALENAPRVSAETLRRSTFLAGVSLLPLTLWTSSNHFAVSLLHAAPSDRAGALRSLMTPQDRSRACVGQASTYVLLAGRCAIEAPLRFGDGSPSTLARRAEVYLFDLGRLGEPHVRAPPGVAEFLQRWPRHSVPRQRDPRRRFTFDQDISDEDLAWIREEIASGTLRIVEARSGFVRLERAASARRDSPPSSDALQVNAMIDRVLDARRREWR